MHGSPLPGSDHTAAVLACLTRALFCTDGRSGRHGSTGARLPTSLLRSKQYLLILETSNLLCRIAKDIVHDVVGILTQHWRRRADTVRSVRKAPRHSYEEAATLRSLGFGVGRSELGACNVKLGTGHVGIMLAKERGGSPYLPPGVVQLSTRRRSPPG